MIYYIKLNKIKNIILILIYNFILFYNILYIINLGIIFFYIFF